MIDIHSHFFPLIGKDVAHQVDPQKAAWLQVDEGGEKGHIMLGDQPFRPVIVRCGTPPFVCRSWMSRVSICSWFVRRR